MTSIMGTPPKYRYAIEFPTNKALFSKFMKKKVKKLNKTKSMKNLIANTDLPSYTAVHTAIITECKTPETPGSPMIPNNQAFNSPDSVSTESIISTAYRPLSQLSRNNAHSQSMKSILSPVKSPLLKHVHFSPLTQQARDNISTKVELKRSKSLSAITTSNPEKLKKLKKQKALRKRKELKQKYSVIEQIKKENAVAKNPHQNLVNFLR
mmetsp:Transcript_14053/g.21276  ORF Transcript_14053/g.21276 Transcript_14053/m.21276 type:complete len:209 (+) Transcript_14053:69-695(+)